MLVLYIPRNSTRVQWKDKIGDFRDFSFEELQDMVKHLMEFNQYRKKIQKIPSSRQGLIKLLASMSSKGVFCTKDMCFQGLVDPKDSSLEERLDTVKKLSTCETLHEELKVRAHQNDLLKEQCAYDLKTAQEIARQHKEDKGLKEKCLAEAKEQKQKLLKYQEQEIFLHSQINQLKKSEKDLLDRMEAARKRSEQLEISKEALEKEWRDKYRSQATDHDKDSREHYERQVELETKLEKLQIEYNAARARYQDTLKALKDTSDSEKVNLTTEKQLLVNELSELKKQIESTKQRYLRAEKNIGERATTALQLFESCFKSQQNVACCLSEVRRAILSNENNIAAVFNPIYCQKRNLVTARKQRTPVIGLAASMDSQGNMTGVLTDEGLLPLTLKIKMPPHVKQIVGSGRLQERFVNDLKEEGVMPLTPEEGLRLLARANHVEMKKVEFILSEETNTIVPVETERKKHVYSNKKPLVKEGDLFRPGGVLDKQLRDF